MSIQITAEFNEFNHQVRTSIGRHWKLFLFDGIVMFILGLLAVALPHFSTLAIELLIGWLFVAGGFFRVATIFRKRFMPGFWWSLIGGIISVALGVILIARPLQGMHLLTVLLTVFFVIEGLVAIFVALDLRRYFHTWGWMLLSGLVNLVLASMIWARWPNSATWVIGLYVGINMIFLSLPLIMIAFAARSIGSVAK